MDTSEYENWYAGLTSSPKDSGRIEVCVVRPKEGERVLPQQVVLSSESGIDGDMWSDDKDPEHKAQVSLMNIHVSRSCAESTEAARLALSGDNLLVDLDLTTENLPTDTVLEIGEARLVVTDQPHLPCKRFRGRFGDVAAKRIGWSVREGLRGRGLLCRIERGGEFGVGDEIRVKRV